MCALASLAGLLALASSACEFCDIGLTDGVVLTLVGFPRDDVDAVEPCGEVTAGTDRADSLAVWNTCTGETSGEATRFSAFGITCDDGRNVCHISMRYDRSAYGHPARAILRFESQDRELEVEQPLILVAKERGALCTTNESFYYEATFTFPTADDGS